ncbi:MAG: type II toxin-antitoxin system VapC family toxin, partial [Gemmatimonadaceae bacterium]|nr:type II toxin-antitoxin system VapC family toxin [Gemmatimonadaceae bacterium]
VVLDIFTQDKTWFEWSATALQRAVDDSVAVINPIVYAEVSVYFSEIEELDVALPPDLFRRDPLPWPAAFLAGKAYRIYRRNAGAKRSPIPDFYIGAHAAVAGFRLLTRDPSVYRSYFPTVKLLSPG